MFIAIYHSSISTAMSCECNKTGTVLCCKTLRGQPVHDIQHRFGTSTIRVRYTNILPVQNKCPNCPKDDKAIVVLCGKFLKYHLIVYPFIPEQEANKIYDRVTTQVDMKVIYHQGLQHDMPRKIATMSDDLEAVQAIGYCDPVPYHPDIRNIQDIIQRHFFNIININTALLNWYVKNSDSLCFHADKEVNPPHYAVIGVTLMQPNTTPRRLVFKNKTKKIEIWLPTGSLYVMEGNMQKYFVHGVPKLGKTEINTGSRLSITFREL